MRMKGLWFRIFGLLVMLALITSCGTNSAGTTTSPVPSPEDTAASPAPSPEDTAASPAPTNGNPITIGSKDFAEQYILSNMYRLLLEHNGMTVEDVVILPNEAAAQEAITSGEIDLYPEYAATALQAILGEELPDPPDRDEIYNQVKEAYEEQFDLIWLERSPFENNQALAMTRERAEELGITTYSDLSEQANELVLGGPAEFFARPDGLEGLQEAYGGFEFRETRQLSPALRYPALQDGTIDVVVAFSTDGEISGLDLQLLEDDQQFYPPYQVAPVVRQDVLEANPQIADTLNELAPLLDEETMSGLNWQVTGPDQREPEDVAQDFLTEQGLLD
jgi:osmoprotectant transport system substrate-binding protein